MGRAAARCAPIGDEPGAVDRGWVTSLPVMTAVISICLASQLAVSLFRLPHGDRAGRRGCEMAVVAASCLFLMAMIHAAITDFRRHHALNLTVLVLAIGYIPLAMAAGLAWTAVASSVVAAILVLVIGFGGFCAGWIDGGDVKLATVSTLWIGAELVLPFLALSGLFAVGLAVLLRVLRRWQTGDAPPLGDWPYSPGIVLAAFLLFSSSQWFAVR